MAEKGHRHLRIIGCIILNINLTCFAVQNPQQLDAFMLTVSLDNLLLSLLYTIKQLGNKKFFSSAVARAPLRGSESGLGLTIPESTAKSKGARRIMRFRNDGFSKCSKDSRYGIAENLSIRRNLQWSIIFAGLPEKIQYKVNCHPYKSCSECNLWHLGCKNSNRNWQGRFCHYNIYMTNK